MDDGPLISIVVGNPRPNSRTRQVGEAVAACVAGVVGATAAPRVIELSELAGDLLVDPSGASAIAKSTIAGSDLLVVTSPVYKASFTGLLKAFLDCFARDELGALPTIPVMVGAGADHALAVEMQLRPVLVEIGASCPTRAVYIVDSTLEALDAELAGWLEPWRWVLSALVTQHRDRR